MDKIGNKAILGNWDWQPKKLKERFGQLTLIRCNSEYSVKKITC